MGAEFAVGIRGILGRPGIPHPPRLPRKPEKLSASILPSLPNVLRWKDISAAKRLRPPVACVTLRAIFGPGLSSAAGRARPHREGGLASGQEGVVV